MVSLSKSISTKIREKKGEITEDEVKISGCVQIFQNYF